MDTTKNLKGLFGNPLGLGEPAQTSQPKPVTSTPKQVPQNNGVDRDALNLARSIALAESDDGTGKPNYNAVGDNGTSRGAYQWQPGNYEAAAKEAGFDPSDFSPVTQDKVAYYQVKKYKDQGLRPDQIAAAWNAGYSKINDWQNHRGYNEKLGVSYDTPAYVEKVKKYYQQQLARTTEGVPAQQAQAPQIQAEPKGLEGFATGVAKSELGLLKNIGSLGAKIGQGIGGLVLGKEKAKEYMPNVYETSGLLSEENLKPKNTSQKIGKVTGDIATAILPAGEITKGATLAGNLVKGEGLGASLLRGAAKVGTEAAANTGVGLIQSGGDVKQSLAQGATAGLLGTIGQLTKNIPENLYGNIFKESKVAIEDNLFGKGSESLAKQAMARGLKGDLPTMAKDVMKGFSTTEKKLMNWAGKTKKTVPIDNKIFETLDNIIVDQGQIGRGEGADKIYGLVSKIKDGQADMKTAIELRRLLDSIRSNPSFNKTITQMRGTAADLKYWSDDLRKAINNAGGKKYMKDFEFYYEAKDALLNAALKNRGGLSGIDTALGAGSVIGGNPLAGLAALAGKKLLETSGTNTYGAQLAGGLNKVRGLITPAISRGVGELVSPER